MTPQPCNIWDKSLKELSLTIIENANYRLKVGVVFVKCPAYSAIRNKYISH